MPRHPDPDLEDRILTAAQKLWKKGGAHSLTMRAVARAARTNTPAVYRRFPHRDDILRALLLRIRQQIIDLLEASQSPAEACERYLDFALKHPHEYELFYQHEYELFHAGARKPLPRPGVEAMKKKLTEMLGESPDGHARLTLALWMLCHGGAMLIIAKTILPAQAQTARSVFTAATLTLLRDASALVAQS